MKQRREKIRGLRPDLVSLQRLLSAREGKQCPQNLKRKQCEGDLNHSTKEKSSKRTDTGRDEGGGGGGGGSGGERGEGDCHLIDKVHIDSEIKK
jgi:hypothetical protein